MLDIAAAKRTQQWEGSLSDCKNIIKVDKKEERCNHLGTKVSNNNTENVNNNNTGYAHENNQLKNLNVKCTTLGNTLKYSLSNPECWKVWYHAPHHLIQMQVEN